MAERIVIDPAKVQITNGATSVPTALDWWQRFTPVWVDASRDEAGCIVLTPNASQPAGRILDLTPVVYRRRLKAVAEFLDSRLYFDFSDAILTSKRGAA